MKPTSKTKEGQFQLVYLNKTVAARLYKIPVFTNVYYYIFCVFLLIANVNNTNIYNSSD